jgi:hypothetical protein
LLLRQGYFGVFFLFSVQFFLSFFLFPVSDSALHKPAAQMVKKSLLVSGKFFDLDIF